MKFTLDFFEKFIYNELNALSQDTIIDGFTNKVETVQKEVSQAKLNLREIIFTTSDERKLELLIQHYQSEIITQLNAAFKYLGSEAEVQITSVTDLHTSKNLCRIVFKGLEEILNYIEMHFSKYFNQDAAIPDCYASISMREMENNLDSIIALSNGKLVDKKIIGIAFHSLTSLTAEAEISCITFRQLIYYKTLLNGIINCLQQENETDYTSSIINYLLYINFNSVTFLKLYIENIILDVQESTSPEGQFEKLIYFRKLINQQQVKPGFALKIDRPSIHEQINRWLDEEIYFQEKRQQLSLLFPPGQQADSAETDCKITTSLSVPELAMMTRLFVESGVIKNKNLSELMRFISKNFTSIRNENISAESLRAKYYKVENSTTNSMKLIFGKLLNDCKKLATILLAIFPSHVFLKGL